MYFCVSDLKLKSKPKMNSFKFNFIFVVLAFLSSCSNDDFSDEFASGTLLSEVRMGNEIYYRYTYTKANFILEEKSSYYSGAKLTINCVYVFDNNKSPINYNCFLAVSKRQ